MTPRPTALYLRVSTPGQVGEDKFGLEVQTRAAEHYAAAHSLPITQVYQDVITGTRATRKALDQLLDEASRYEVVLVSSVDRLARRTAIAYAVLEELLETGVEVHSADMGIIDPKDEMSSMNFGVRSVFAQAEHMRIAKRLRGGMLAKVRSGKPVVPLNGYGWKDGQIFEEEAQWVRQMYGWAREGWTAHAILTEMNRLGVPRRTASPWSDSTVKYILRNPVYKGLYSYGGARPSRGDGRDLVTCEVEAIVPPAEWEATQRSISSRKKGGRPFKSKSADEFPLKSRLRCGLCGSTMTAVKNVPQAKGLVPRQAHLAYYCYRVYKRAGMSLELCTHRRHYGAKKIHPFVLEQLHALLLDDQALLAALPSEPPKALDVRPAVAAIEKRLKNLKMLALDGVIPPDEYKETRAELEGQRQALEAPQTIAFVPPNLVAARQKLGEVLASGNLTEIARRLDLRVVVHPDGRLDLLLSAL
ncbi:recombinase family protein [Deinococcus gobiensis]|uniref:Recombinase n=1 Tax=Deinococcus gobiensis (strain DSM 21396 / JCM 16679 / CGMCC 1.7299 / I-0) TaxID=745776 RepID=H8GX72_DEIGI|nr:recombinase family protein [Deinococcus gobiensis]AFD25801.1 Recombinase [Deinococcus gobiensis I-0]